MQVQPQRFPKWNSLILNHGLQSRKLVKMGDLGQNPGGSSPFTLLPNSDHGPDNLPDSIREMARMCRVVEESIEDAYPCSPMQEALMAASAETDSNSYMLQMVCKLGEQTSLTRFQKAWQETAQANPIMRTRIIYLEPYGTIQVVMDGELTWCMADSLQDYLREDAALPMSFGHPLWRFAFITSTDDTGLEERFFAWTVHHAVIDGFSTQEILKCVALRYKNRPLPEREPFSSFIGFLKSANSTDSQEYWRRELGNCSSLPFPAPPNSGFRAVPSSVFTRDVIFQQPDGLGLSKTLILQSAWALLMSYYTGTPEVTFGAISSGRSAAVEGIREMSGPTITIIPVTVRANPSQSVMQFLGSGADRAKRMLPYEHAGLSNIRRYLGEEASKACDFQNLLVIQPGAFSSRAADMMGLLGMNVLPHLWKMETHSYPLVTTITYTSAGFHLQLDYDHRILHQQQVANIFYQYEQILRQLALADPASPISSISALSPTDKAQIFGWNKYTPRSQNICMPTRFRNQVLMRPNNPAVCSWDGNLTYSELDNVSSRLANRLIEMGVGPETLVALYFEKSMWTLVAILSILKAGGAYVPLDPSNPPDRLQEIINLTRIEFAVTSPAHAEVLQGLCKNIVILDSTIPYEDKMDTQPFSRAAPSNTAYIIFTSGSTGKPKGVVMQHSALCTSIMEHGRRLGFCSEWRTLQFSSHTFDVSIGEMLTTLAFGGCVCVPSSHQRVNDLGQAIRELNANVALLTPTVASLITPEEAPSLHTLILGGESVTKENIDRWANHVRLSNAFGPTEACVYCSTADLSIESNPSNIGMSVGGNTWVANPGDHESLTPIGCVGELVVSGPTLAREYFENTSETEAAFVQAPSWMTEAGHSSSRIYKTGDLVRCHHDGTMQFIGRKDSQVKIRGFRVELGEIENRISEASKAGNVLAILSTSGPCKNKLVCVICFESGKYLEGMSKAIELAPNYLQSKLDNRIDELRAELGAKVPDYMVPSVWVVLNRIPMLSSGKMDRKALKVWVETMDSVTYKICSLNSERTRNQNIGTTKLSPASLIFDLRTVWSQVLNVPANEIGSKTTFMSLGGDSISAIQLVAKCRKIGIKISVQNILSSKTLGKLAPTASRTQLPGHAQDYGASPSPDTLFTISPMQQRFFALNGSVAESGRYNQGFVIKFQEAISPDIVRDAFDAIVQKHPMLRASFSFVGHQWQQKCLAFSVDCYRLKFQGLLSKDEIAATIEAGQSSIDIAGPVFSVDVFKSESGGEIFLTAHHLVVDLVSWRIIMQDLEDFIKVGTVTPQPSISFPAWTQIVQEKFSESAPVPQPSQIRCADYSFWGVAETENTYAGVEKLCWNLDPQSTQLLLQNSARSFIEPVDFMISALALSFSLTFNNRECPPILVEGHGREPWSSEIDLSSTVGWFTVLYPINNFPDSNESAAGLLTHIRDARKQHPDNGLAYFSRQVYNTDKSQSLSAVLSWEIQFNYQGMYQQFENETSLFQLTEYEDLDRTLIGRQIRRNAIIEIEARVRNRCLEFSFAFNEKMEHKGLVKQWVEMVKTVLMEMIQNVSLEQPQCLKSILQNHFADLDINQWENMLRAKLGPTSEIVLEDAYPCSPFQEHVLKCQSMDSSVFNVKWGIEISQSSGAPVSLTDLETAWRLIVSRHAILRSIFLFDKENSTPLQVVLKCLEPQSLISSQHRSAEGEGTAQITEFETQLLPHRLVLLQGESGSVKCMFEASHAILDGWSVRLMMRDFLAAYENKLSSAPRPLYKSFINLFEHARIAENREYWKGALRHQQPCLLLPSAPNPADVASSERHTIIALPDIPVTPFSEISTKHNFTTASLIDAAWAQSLISLTSKSSLAFGYTVSGRDLPIDNALEIAGPMINVLAYHIPDVESDQSLVEVARALQEQRIKDSEHIFGSLHDVVEDLKGGRLWNTGVNYQWVSNKEVTRLGNGSRDATVKELEGSDPWDVSIQTLLFCCMRRDC